MKDVFNLYSKKVIVNTAVGLHAKPAAFFVHKASSFKSSIFIEHENKRVNAKSILGILSLSIIHGSVINIVADGCDEEEAVNELEAFLSEFDNYV